MISLPYVSDLATVPAGTVAMFDLGEGHFAPFEARRPGVKGRPRVVWVAPGDAHEYTPDDLSHLLPATVVYAPERT